MTRAAGAILRPFFRQDESSGFRCWDSGPFALLGKIFEGGSTVSWPNMGLGHLAKRPFAQSDEPASSTFEPCHAGVPSLAGPLRTEPSVGTYRLAFYSWERRSLVCIPGWGQTGTTQRTPDSDGVF